MDLILPVAYLEICEKCGGHGCVVFTNKKKSDEFNTRVEAYGKVTVALATGDITEPEARHLREEISNWVPGTVKRRAAGVVQVKSPESTDQMAQIISLIEGDSPETPEGQKTARMLH
mgnify:CR=1 FL=1